LEKKWSALWTRLADVRPWNREILALVVDLADTFRHSIHSFLAVKDDRIIPPR
jgi:hypothetical protein